MRSVASFAILTGLVVGIVGGLFEGAPWLGVGAAIGVLGVGALWLLAVRKDPIGLLKAEAEVESMASGYPTHANEMPQQGRAEAVQVKELVRRPGTDAQMTRDKSA